MGNSGGRAFGERPNAGLVHFNSARNVFREFREFGGEAATPSPTFDFWKSGKGQRKVVRRFADPPPRSRTSRARGPRLSPDEPGGRQRKPGECAQIRFSLCCDDDEGNESGVGESPRHDERVHM